jgi:hypothetical protein
MPVELTDTGYVVPIYPSKHKTYLNYIVTYLNNYIALMMEAASVSETSVNFYQTTRRNNLYFCKNFIFKYFIPTLEKTQRVSVTKINYLMFFRDKIAVYSQNRTKSINTLCWQNVKFLNVKENGKYSKRCALKT